tara:strand:- start:866 stop:2047 length:1182 start_codon:yes stop_codon:yes gene_type:complete
MSLSYLDLISEDFRNHTKSIIANDNNEIITYFMDKRNTDFYLNRYTVIDGQAYTWENDIQVNGSGHSLSSQEFIRSIFNKIDTVIDLDFKEMNTNNGSEIDIYSVRDASNFSQNTVGQVMTQKSISGSWWDLYWKESGDYQKLDSLEKSTIIHEIGHTLGLSHPANQPLNPKWTTDDTVMSYNKGINGWNEWFTNKDLNALKSIWGRENDNNDLVFSKQSFEYSFFQNNSFNYSIETDIGKEDITSIKSLIFTDKVLDVSEDIINVFKLIKEVDPITGKIFRLYQSAFDRFPDYKGIDYWINKNNSGENSYRQTAHSFILSNEYKEKYGTENSNENYLSNLYSNVLNRTPDDTGLSYWLGQLNTQSESRVEVLMGFSESNENINNFLQIIGKV